MNHISNVKVHLKTRSGNVNIKNIEGGKMSTLLLIWCSNIYSATITIYSRYIDLFTLSDLGKSVCP